MFCSMSGAIKECRIMKNVIPGEVYAIPLFLKGIHPMTRVSLKDLRGDDKKVCLLSYNRRSRLGGDFSRSIQQSRDFRYIY